MKVENINKTLPPLRVLVAPLDWGLGHATRCIPIIKHLIINGAEVIIAAEGACARLLSAEFPNVKMLELGGYRVKYQGNGKSFKAQIFRQIPGLFKTISNENKWLKEIVREEKIQVVISDNRFGLYNANAYTIFITHQLQIKTGNILTDQLLQYFNYRFINKFNECWVPDEERSPGLAHELSHPQKLPSIPVKYVGLLSRFKQQSVADKKYSWCILLSGPEPQRTVWEQILLQTKDAFYGEIALVRGLPQGGEQIIAPARWEIYNHLSSQKLNELLQNSNAVVCRSGYSTMMDLRACGKKALIIPTPQQTEQEYLAEKNNGRNGFVTAFQFGEWKAKLKEVEELAEPSAAQLNEGEFIRNWLANFLQAQAAK